jgi:hypothetical protein
MSASIQTWSDSFATRSAAATAAHGAYAGALGASAIALLFLLVDSVIRAPLWTPSLAGGVLFAGASPSGPVTVDLALVALYSILHAGLFLSFGAAVALVAARLPRAPSPAVLAIGCFLGLELGVLAGSRLLAPGMASAIGLGWITLGNALAALAMTAWLRDLVPIPVRARDEAR